MGTRMSKNGPGLWGNLVAQKMTPKSLKRNSLWMNEWLGWGSQCLWGNQRQWGSHHPRGRPICIGQSTTVGQSMSVWQLRSTETTFTIFFPVGESCHYQKLLVFCPRRLETAGDYVMAAIVYGVCLFVCLFVCVSRPLISLDPALGFWWNLVHRVFRVSEAYPTTFINIR